MKNEVEKLQELVKKTKEILNQKDCLFKYDVYVKVDSGLFISFDLHSFKSNKILCQYCYNLNIIEAKGIGYIVDEVIKKSKKIILNNIKNIGAWSPENDRVVLVLDIMGFKNMISTLSHDEIYIRLYKIFTSFSNLNNMQSESYKDRLWVELFSDTVFIISRDCSDTTITILNMFVSEILYAALKLGIIFKGAYAEGKIIVDRENHICFGQPIIDAYLLEEKQAWFGIACHESIKSISEDKIDVIHLVEGEEKVVQIKPLFINYNIPLKCGTEKLIAFAWFNHAVVSYDEVKDEMLSLKASCPSQIKVYYDRTLDFMSFCEEQGKIWLGSSYKNKD